MGTQTYYTNNNFAYQDEPFYVTVNQDYKNIYCTLNSGRNMHVLVKMAVYEDNIPIETKHAGLASEGGEVNETFYNYSTAGTRYLSMVIDLYSGWGDYNYSNWMQRVTYDFTR